MIEVDSVIKNRFGAASTLQVRNVTLDHRVRVCMSIAGQALRCGEIQTDSGEDSDVIFSETENFDYVISEYTPSTVAPVAGWVTGSGPFGVMSDIAPSYSTAWPADTTLWLRKTFSLKSPSRLLIQGRVENRIHLFINGQSLGVFNENNIDIKGAPHFEFVTEYLQAGTHTLTAKVDDEVDTLTDDSTYVSLKATVYQQEDSVWYLPLKSNLLSSSNTPVEFESDYPSITTKGVSGFANRYNLTVAETDLPDFITRSANGVLGLAFTVSVTNPPQSSVSPTTVVELLDTTTNSKKIGFHVKKDSRKSDEAMLYAEVSTGTVYELGRPSWTFSFKFPEITIDNKRVRPQALKFIDDYLLITGHYEDTLSKAFIINKLTGVVVNSFLFPLPYVHVSSCAVKSDGSVWFLDYDTEKLLKVNIASSIASGNAVIELVYDLSALTFAGAIDWVTISGIEYLICQEYENTTATKYTYVIPATAITDGGVFLLTDRFKRFTSGISRAQGIRYKDGKVYLTSNKYPLESTNTGILAAFSFDEAMASVADGGAMAQVGNWGSPSPYPQDLDFDPTTGNVWTMTEGYYSVDDNDQFLSVWQKNLQEPTETVEISVKIDNQGDTEIKINDNLFISDNSNSLVKPNALKIMPEATNEVAPSTYFCGYISDIILKNGEILPENKSTLLNQPVVESYPVAVSQAEMGVGEWVNESGAIATRGSNPNPKVGTAYFSGGSNPITIAYQRFDLLSVMNKTPSELLGVLQEKDCWITLEWFQSSFNGVDTDRGGLGIRFIGEDFSELKYVEPSDLYFIDRGIWFKRSIAGKIPTGARFFDIVYRAVRLNGTNNDVYVDDISANVHVSTPNIY